MVYIPNYCKSLDSAFFSVNAFENALGGDWLSLVFLGLLGMLLLLAVVYLVSQLLRIPKMEAWARFEIFQVFATAALAIFISGVLFGMCHWDSTFMYGPNGGASTELIQESKELCGMADAKEFTPYCSAQSYLLKVKNRGDNIFQMLIGMNYVLSYLFKATWNSSPMGIGFTVEPLAGFNQLMNVFMVAISGFIVSYLTVLVQMRVLDYFLIAVPYYFLPLGLLMRTFAPTREFGGAVVGFAIASVFFYPMLLTLNDAILFAPFDAFSDDASALANAAYSGDTSAFEAYLRAAGELPPDVIEKGISPIAGAQELEKAFGSYSGKVDASGLNVEDGDAPVSSISKYFTEPDGQTPNMLAAGRTWELGEFIFKLLQIVFMYSIAAVILPIINFLLYIEIARELTHVLGTQMDLTNLTRMV